MRKTNWAQLLGWDEDQLEDLRNAGFAYIRQGRYQTALAIFGGLVVLNPNNFYDAQTLGALHLQLGNADEAAKYLDRALKMEGDHSATLLNMTKAMFMQGKTDEGLKLARILEKDENRGIANTAKALILAYS